MKVAKRSQWRAAATWAQGDDGELQQHLEQELRRLNAADAFQTLGVDYRANAREIRAAFLLLTKQFHPSRFARRDRNVVRAANEVFLIIKQAYSSISSDVLRDRQLAKLGRAPTEAVPLVPVSPEMSDPPPARPTSRLPSGRVPTLPRRNRSSVARTPAAATNAQPVAVASAPPAGAREIPGGDAPFRHALDLCQRHLWAEAREALQRLAVQEPQNKQYRAHMHYAWGREHADLGRTDDARAEYRRALSADPGFTRAQHALDGLPGAEKARDRGFFSRLFRK